MLLKKDQYYRVMRIEEYAFSNIPFLSLHFSSEMDALPFGIGKPLFTGETSNRSITMNRKLYQNLKQQERVQDSQLDGVLISSSTPRSHGGYLILGNQIIGIDPQNPPEVEKEGTELVIPKIPDATIEKETYYIDINLKKNQSMIQSYTYGKEKGIPKEIEYNPEEQL